MNISFYLTLLSFSAALFYLFMGFYVIRLDNKLTVNRIFFLICIALGIWSGPYLFLFQPISLSDLKILIKISSAAWAVFIGSFLHFSLQLTERQRWLNRRWKIGLIYLIPLFILVHDIVGTPYFFDFEWSGIGWIQQVDTKSWYFWFFLSANSLYFAVGLINLLLWRARTTDREKKNISDTILISFFIAFGAGIAINIILPLLDQQNVPQLVHMLLLIWIFGIFIGIRRGNLLLYGLEINSSVLLSNISDMILLIDRNYRIIKCSSVFADMLGLQNYELRNTLITDYVRDEQILIDNLIFVKTYHQSVNNLNMILKTASDSDVLVHYNISVWYTRSGIELGFILVGRVEPELNHIYTDDQNMILPQQFHNKALYELSLITNIMMDFIQPQTGRNIYDFISERFIDLMDKIPSTIALFHFNATNKECRFMSVHSNNKRIQNKVEYILSEPRSHEPIASEIDQWDKLFSYKLIVKYEDDLEPLIGSYLNEEFKSNNIFPKEHSVYLIGFLINHIILGFAVAGIDSSFSLKNNFLMNTYAYIFAMFLYRERFENALKESEEKYRSFVENANEGIVLLQDMNIIFVNQKLLDLMEMNYSEIIGKPLTDFITEKHRLPFVQWLNEISEFSDTMTVFYELEMTNGKNKTLPVEFNSGIVNYAEKPAVFLFIRDLTERKKMIRQEMMEQIYRDVKGELWRIIADSSLRTEKDLIRTVFSYCVRSLSEITISLYQFDSKGVLRLDMAVDQKSVSESDPRIEVSPVLWHEIAKYSYYRFILSKNEETSLDDMTRAVQLILIKRKASDILFFPFKLIDRFEGLICFEYSGLRNRIWEAGEIDIGLELVKVLSVGLSKLRSDKALHDSEMRYRLLAENPFIGMILISPDGTILEMNRRLAEIIGLSEETIITGKNALELDRLTQFGIDMAIKQCLTSLEPTHLEKESYHGDKPTYLKFVFAPFFSLDEELMGVQGMVEDITERKKAETGMKELMIRLKATNESLREFAYVASHDLKEPLRMVGSYMGIIKKKLKDEEILKGDLLDFINFAESGASRMSQLIDSLLDYSRLETQTRKPQWIDLNVVMEEALKIMDSEIEKQGVEVVVQPLPNVMGDAQQFTQLFQNLIANAIKYRKDDVVPRIEIGYRKRDHKYVFSVTDNGIGISPQFHERIFQVFQRLHTREKYEGTGIGLSICKRIVEQHGGTIWIESEEGRGSTFFFTIPVNQEL